MPNQIYTREQVKVIEHDGSHAVVAAVAGSGKTETLVGRVQRLLREVNPDRIAVVMFNRDAAKSFRERFERSAGGSPPEIRTFNSMGNKIVNRFVELGLLPSAKIVEKDFRRTQLARDAFTRVFKQVNGDDVSPDKELIDSFISYILLVKSDTKSPEDVFEHGKYGQMAKGFPQAFAIFETDRRRMQLRFYEDQLFDPVKLMLARTETQRYISNRLDHLIVDEAQDMNGIQIALLRILAGTQAKVMLVGDEDQAIYDWRGSKPDYLVSRFEKDFPGATRYTLPHTFRFGHILSLAASHLISLNANRNAKISISAENTPRTRIRCVALDHGVSGLGDIIKGVLESGVPTNDVSVLVRAYSLSVALELELHHHGIPYFVYGRPPLSRIPEISALVGVLQLAGGRWKTLEPDDLSFTLRNLLQRPALYLDKLTADAVIEKALGDPTRLSDAIRSAITRDTKPFLIPLIRDRADLLEMLASGHSVDDRVITVLDRYMKGTNFEEAVKKQSPTVESAEAILANVSAFRLIAQKHQGSINDFLEEIDPLIDSSSVDPPDEPHIWISSIHRAKGAQWPIVFVPGLVSRAFPRDNLLHEQIEAERRLFYVAITRASQELYIAHPKDERFAEAVQDISKTSEYAPVSAVSRFLWEMELAISEKAGLLIEKRGPFIPQAVDRPSIANYYFQQFPFGCEWNYSKRQLRVAEDAPGSDRLEPGDIKSGARVFHATYGLGTVDRWIDDLVVRVIFDDGDSRMLDIRVAKLNRVRDNGALCNLGQRDDEIAF